MTPRGSAPFRAFTTLEQEIHELIDRMGGRAWSEGLGWRPDTDIYRDGATLVVEAELPGIDADRDLRVTVDGCVLSITGISRQRPDGSESDRLITERRFGPFHREVMLPDGCCPAGIDAAFGNGLLTVRVACPEEPAADAAPSPIRVMVRGRSAGNGDG
ncbi:MAG: Hsp20/alpha crystallin family protein [Actinobacteria bacterium]|nr:Hsp20/alpha crystallin family protein [Actinomycetota bacterium]